MFSLSSHMTEWVYDNFYPNLSLFLLTSAKK